MTMIRKSKNKFYDFIEGNIPITKNNIPTHYRISSLYVNNFKSLQEFKIDFSDAITVFVGDNGAGKSTLLQALAFLKYCCLQTTDEYMNVRNLAIDDVMSNLLPKSQRIISFKVDFINRDDSEDKLIWEITFITDKSNKKISLRSEEVIWSMKSVPLLQYGTMKPHHFRFNERHSDLETIPLGEYTSSHINIINEKLSTQYPHLYAIKLFFQESEPLDLLTPKDMRRSARGKERSLGFSGEKLPNLIYKLTGKEKESLLASLRKLLPQMQAVKSVRSGSGRAGWAHLETIEQFNEHPIAVQSGGISDGVLRLVALFALPFLNKSGGVILLDEVEDGINSSNIAILMEFLREYSKNNRQQIILTTHSTVLLDYANPEEIRCLYRDINGFTQCVNFLDLKDIKEELAYLYPGEAMLNRGKDFMKAFTEER